MADIWPRFLLPGDCSRRSNEIPKCSQSKGICHPAKASHQKTRKKRDGRVAPVCQKSLVSRLSRAVVPFWFSFIGFCFSLKNIFLAHCQEQRWRRQQSVSLIIDRLCN